VRALNYMVEVCGFLDFEMQKRFSVEARNGGVGGEEKY